MPSDDENAIVTTPPQLSDESQGYSKAVLRVFEDNERARRFYDAMGLAPEDRVMENERHEQHRSALVTAEI